jgi:hypothetical protein
VELSERKMAIRCKWVFKKKEAILKKKKGGKVQGLPNSEGLFTAKRS